MRSARIRSLSRRVHRRSDLLWPVLALAFALIAIRAALPFIVKDYVNDKLHALEAYDGSVVDVDLGLLRGAYRIDGIEIVKRGPKQPTPFFGARRVDLSVEWHSLLNGALVAEAHFYEPQLNLVEAKSGKQEQLGKEEQWHARLEELFPFTFNTVAVHDGTITFRTPGIDTKDALVARNVDGVITNITNVVETEKDNFAEYRLTADVLGGAKATVYGSAEPFTQHATFDLNLAIENVKVAKANPWLRQYLKADASQGGFDLYLEVASSNGRYKGLAKPMLRDVQFISLEEAPKENPLKTLWQGTLQLAAEVFENQPRKQVAAQVPFSGTVAGGKPELLAAIASVLRNAFVSAFTHSIEGKISLKDVKAGEPSGDTDSG